MGHISSLFNGAGDQTLISRVSPTSQQREFLQANGTDLAEHLKISLKAKHGHSISTWAQGSYKYDTQIKPVHPRGTAQGRRGDHGGVARILGRRVWCLAARVVDDPGRRTVAVGGAPRHARQHGQDPRQGGARLRRGAAASRLPLRQSAPHPDEGAGPRQPGDLAGLLAAQPGAHALGRGKSSRTVTGSKSCLEKNY